MCKRRPFRPVRLWTPPRMAAPAEADTEREAHRLPACRLKNFFIGLRTAYLLARSRSEPLPTLKKE